MSEAIETIMDGRAKLNAALAIMVTKDGIADADVALLRRAIEAAEFLERADIERLFRIDAAAPSRPESWADLLVEAVTDHVVWDLRPTGVVDEANAQWVLGLVDGAGTPSSFAVLIGLLERAHRVPRWLEAAARARACRGFERWDLPRAA